MKQNRRGFLSLLWETLYAVTLIPLVSACGGKSGGGGGGGGLTTPAAVARRFDPNPRTRTYASTGGQPYYERIDFSKSASGAPVISGLVVFEIDGVRYEGSADSFERTPVMSGQRVTFISLSTGARHSVVA